jgi:asparagine synthase (glutamine-hydrolysing)
MCGIGAIVGEIPDASAVRAVAQQLARRGPGGGVFIRHRAGILVAEEDYTVDDGRTSALLVQRGRSRRWDADRAGRPWVSVDGQIAVVLDGVIYNAGALRDELRALGRRVIDDSAEDLVLAGYAAWGVGVFRRLRGMFALAILDPGAGKIVLARDQFGIRPLYFARTSSGVAFASEVRALLRLPGVSRKTDPQRVYDYLRFGSVDVGSSTLFAAIEQFPAAHYLELTLDGSRAIAPRRYWSPDGDLITDMTFGEAAARVRELYMASVAEQRRDDGEVGALLSGGVDYSSNVAVLRQLLGPDRSLRAFSYIAEDPRISEQRWVDEVARATGVEVHKIRLDPAELRADLKELIAVQDLPFGSTSIYAQYRMLQYAKGAGITALLDGQGADEGCGGYALHRRARLASLLACGSWVEAARFGRRAAAWPGNGSILRQVAPLVIPTGLRGLIRRAAGRNGRNQWLNWSWFVKRNVSLNGTEFTLRGGSLREELRRALFDSSLPALLRYADRNAMAHGVEVRFPFLDPVLTEFVFSLPEEYIIGSDGETKAVLRGAMRGIVPDSILDRRDKVGFATPEQHWLTTLDGWVKSVIRGAAIDACPVLVPEAVTEEWEAILTGRSPFDFRVWRWLNLVEWSRLVGAEYE